MDQSKIKEGDELYYLDRTRTTVGKGTVSKKRRSKNGKVIGVSFQGSYWKVSLNRILGPVMPIEENP